MLLQHNNGFIFITPDDASESRDIMNVLNENNLFTNNSAGFRTGRWFVKDRFLPLLNKILIPFKDNIRKDVSMTEYIALFKNQGQVDGKDRIKILFGPNECKIIGPKRSVPEEALQKKMRYFFQGAVNCKSYKEKRWDGFIVLYNKQKRTFPSGFLDKALSVFDSKKIPYTVEQTFEYPERQFSWVVNDGITPDPDQIEAVEVALKEKRGIVKAPTGFGKTAVLAKRLTAGFGVTTLFVANKKALLDDAAEEFLSGIDGLDYVGQIKDGVFDQRKTKEDPRITSPVIVATIQSLAARLEDERTAPILKYWLNNVCKFVERRLLRVASKWSPL